MALEIEKIILAGHSGQGLGLLGRVLAEAGLIKNLEVTYLPAYGPIIRPGDTECTVILSTVPVGSPVVGVPDVLIACNRTTFKLLSSRLKAGGLLVFDCSTFEPAPDELRDDVRPIGVPTADLLGAGSAGVLAAAALVGAYVSYSTLLDREAIIEAMRRVSRLTLPENPLDDKSVKVAIEKGSKFVSDEAYRHSRYRYSIFMG
jgi:Pyruvate/2-oxoacid:ferredoxin oxidoreductase gamma subunit